MSPLETAIVLSAIVITVLVATRPVPTRRRPAPPARSRHTRTSLAGRGKDTLTRRRRQADHSPDPSHRNHWDRSDIAIAVGRDHAHPDVTLTLWP
jgi:hypothetical protein